ncbi:siderophore ABC transporter substrate-binding protein [Kineococcus terrestris]|uniref:siderophore ABC transporter substrate-binding protein n=1 Tax=Kineococcus terrestris TaxID=2044856 RepID=UPI0034DB5679
MLTHVSRRALAGASVAVGAALLTACSGAEAGTGDGTETATVVVSANNGEVEVPAEPLRVAVLDNTAFETVKAFGITPVAVPKPLLPGTGFEDWEADESIADAGSHREPVLEAVSEAEPDLILGGYRFEDHTEQLSRIAPVLDLAPSEDHEGGYVESLKRQTETLGEVLGHPEEAAALIADLEDSVAAAAAATGGESVFLAVASGGRIDNGASRLGRILEPLDLVNVLADEGDAVHSDSGLAPETIAQLNPDWMVVLDRDAAVEEGATSPARQLVSEQEAWAGTTFTTQDQVVYLPPTFYVTEGVQAYTAVFDQITDAFTA